jgi:hypothetical protein
MSGGGLGGAARVRVDMRRPRLRHRQPVVWDSSGASRRSSTQSFIISSPDNLAIRQGGDSFLPARLLSRFGSCRASIELALFAIDLAAYGSRHLLAMFAAQAGASAGWME